MRLRRTLIGQVPSPSVSAARMQVCNASAASTVALKKPSSAPLSCFLPRNSPSRSSRLASPRKTRNTGAAPIHGMSGNRAASRSRLSRSFSQMHRSLLEIRFRRGRERSRQQQPDQRIGHGALAVTALRAPHQQLTQPRIIRRLAAEIDVEPEPGAEFVGVRICHWRSPASLVIASQLRAGEAISDNGILRHRDCFVAALLAMTAGTRLAETSARPTTDDRPDVVDQIRRSSDRCPTR